MLPYIPTCAPSDKCQHATYKCKWKRLRMARCPLDGPSEKPNRKKCSLYVLNCNQLKIYIQPYIHM